MTGDLPPGGDAPRCACGHALQKWHYQARGKPTGVWCAGLGDLVDYQSKRRTQHDVYDLRERRVQRGQCAEHPEHRPDASL